MTSPDETAEAPEVTPPVKKLKRRQRKFIAAYSRCGVITHAAEIAGIYRQTHRNWLLNDPVYAKAFEDAKEEACERLEQEARRRAEQGVRRYKFDRGVPVLHPTLCVCGADRKLHNLVDNPHYSDEDPGMPQRVPGPCEETGCSGFYPQPYYEHEYSDQLLMFLLKANAPEKYRERYDHKVDATVSGGVLLVPSSVDPGEWARVAAAQQANARAGGVGEGVDA